MTESVDFYLKFLDLKIQSNNWRDYHFTCSLQITELYSNCGPRPARGNAIADNDIQNNYGIAQGHHLIAQLRL
jgi:hypothetical protein